MSNILTMFRGGLIAPLATFFAALLASAAASAQFDSTVAQNTATLLGNDSANTGIYEIEAMIPIGLSVAIAVTVAVVGFYVVRALIMKIRA